MKLDFLRIDQQDFSRGYNGTTRTFVTQFINFSMPPYYSVPDWTGR
jgi:hypothetical protein